MTTIFNFVPGRFSPYTFQPILDGNQYNAVVKWNLQAQRWYIILTDDTNTEIFTLPLIGSLTPIPIDSIGFSEGVVTATFIDKLFFPIGLEANINFNQCTPAGYNGVFLSTVVGPTTIQYFLQNDPGPIVTFGFASYDINLAAGYFNSTLVFRSDSQWFEVNP
jgi:hypothetical protein